MGLKITELKLRKILAKNKWEKLAAADELGVDEASIRRACRKYLIDTEEEKKKSAGMLKPEVFSIARPKDNGEARPGTFVVVPDTHAQYYVRPVLSAITAFIKDFKPEVIVHIGDLLDNECLMAKVKTKYISFDEDDVKSLDTEFFYANEVLDKIDEVAPKNCQKIFLTGNHEFRADLILKRFPHFSKLVDYRERLQLKNRGWEWHPYLEPVKIGKLHLIHGEFYGANSVRKHLIHYQKNVMYGHTHSIEQTTLQSPMREIPIYGATIGCICDLSPDYQRNKSNAWEHGFAYGVFDEKSGDFQPVVVRVVHNRFYADGKWYVGKSA